MELITKCAAAAILGSVICLLTKKFNPEISAALSAAVTVCILTAAAGLLNVFDELMFYSRNILGNDAQLLRPVLKCLGIAVVSSICADICRDASQSAAAAALEFAGTLCAASVAMPTIIEMLICIGGFA